MVEYVLKFITAAVLFSSSFANVPLDHIEVQRFRTVASSCIKEVLDSGATTYHAFAIYKLAADWLANGHAVPEVERLRASCGYVNTADYLTALVEGVRLGNGFQRGVCTGYKITDQEKRNALADLAKVGRYISKLSQNAGVEHIYTTQPGADFSAYLNLTNRTLHVSEMLTSRVFTFEQPKAHESIDSSTPYVDYTGNPQFFGLTHQDMNGALTSLDNIRSLQVWKNYTLKIVPNAWGESSFTSWLGWFSHWYNCITAIDPQLWEEMFKKMESLRNHNLLLDFSDFVGDKSIDAEVVNEFFAQNTAFTIGTGGDDWDDCSTWKGDSSGEEDDEEEEEQFNSTNLSPIAKGLFKALAQRDVDQARAEVEAKKDEIKRQQEEIERLREQLAAVTPVKSTAASEVTTTSTALVDITRWAEDAIASVGGLPPMNADQWAQEEFNRQKRSLEEQINILENENPMDVPVQNRQARALEIQTTLTQLKQKLAVYTGFAADNTLRNIKRQYMPENTQASA